MRPSPTRSRRRPNGSGRSSLSHPRRARSRWCSSEIRARSRRFDPRRPRPTTRRSDCIDGSSARWSGSRRATSPALHRSARSGRELTELATRCLAEALAQADATVPIAIIGMGKLGGGELNYSSDVDVLFVHEGEGELEHAEQVARAVLRIMSTPGADGILFRTDAALRPEGRAGAMSRTLEAYEAYWERWAQTWERQALIKANPVAGDTELGAAFIARAAGRGVARRARPRRGARDPHDEGAFGGAAAPHGYVGARSEARLRRHPRHRVRGATAATRPRTRRPQHPRTRHAGCARGSSRPAAMSVPPTPQVSTTRTRGSVPSSIDCSSSRNTKRTRFPTMNEREPSSRACSVSATRGSEPRSRPSTTRTNNSKRSCVRSTKSCSLRRSSTRSPAWACCPKARRPNAWRRSASATSTRPARRCRS